MSDVPSISSLSSAQQDALRVLVAAHPKYVRGGKRRSSSESVPHVNTKAADSLVKLKLARISFIAHAGPFTSAYEYAANNDGLTAASK